MGAEPYGTAKHYCGNAGCIRPGAPGRERCTNHQTVRGRVRRFAAWLAPETVAAGSAGGWKPKAELLRRGLSPAGASTASWPG